MAKLLPILLLLVGLGGGIGAGIMLAPAPAPEDMEQAAAGDDHVEEEHVEEEPAEGEEVVPNDFMKINNQFIIPVVERDKMTAMVVISLSLEMRPGTATKLHTFEPKLRDAFLRVLFDHANMGGFRGAFTRSEVLDPLRTSLREEAKRYLGRDLVDVLILEITRQDV